MSSNEGSTRNLRLAFDGVAIASVFIIVVWLSMRRLQGTPYEINFSAAFEGVKSALGATLPAALKIWTFWAVAAAIGAAILRKLDPEIDLRDALLGGTAGAWCAAYVLGELLGPIGLWRAPTIWLALIAAGIWALPSRPTITISRLSAGQGFALLALGLLLVGYLPLELGSPTPPYMDVLNYPASVQRIMSFGRYLPFDNDPYGCWGPQAQTPAVDLFYSMLGMGSRVNLGVLAESGALIPMAAFMIFAAYRFGAATIGDTGGGIATMMLFFTNTFRRLVGMKGTTISLGLVALGLAFLIDRRSRSVLIAMGFLILGTAAASHAMEGGFGIALAAFTIVWRGQPSLKVLVLKATGLAGAVLIAVPDFAVATRTMLPYPILPLIQIVGIAVIVIAVRMLPPASDSVAVEGPAGGSVRWRTSLLVAVFAIALIWQNATDQGSVFANIIHQFPMLSVLTALGLAGLGALRATDSETVDATPVLGALLLAMGVEVLGKYLASMSGGAQFGAEVVDLHYKLDEYWAPFFMTFAAAVPFLLIWKRGSHVVVAAALIIILVFPWNQRNANYDYEEHSIAENWGIDLGTASRGYWFSTPDARWTVGPTEWALIDLLRQEQRAGRITTKTHILHLTQDMIVWKDFNRFSVFTGIDDDPIVYEIPASDIGWTAGSRIRMMSALPEALAERPPYILIQVAPPVGVGFPPDGYDMIFNRDKLQLYRRHHLVQG